MNDLYLSNQLKKSYNERTFRNKIRWFQANYEKYIPRNKDASVLEVGPGFGELMHFFCRERGLNKYSAIDNSKEVVDFCNSAGLAEVEHIDDLIDYLNKIEENKFHLVVMLHVLEHIPKSNVIDVIRSVKRVLVDGGVLIVEVPNIANPFIGEYMFYSDFTHNTAFTDASLDYIAKSSGFDRYHILECKQPATNIYRLIQRSLQNFIELIYKLLCKIYLPSISILASHSIALIAIKKED